jgi:hypothetical protein
MSIFKATTPITESLLNNAHTRTFPLVKINIEKSNESQNYEVTLKVGSELYDNLVEKFGQPIILYVCLDGQAGAWTWDMIMTINLLQDLNLMSDTLVWINNAREAISAELSGEETNSKRKDESAFETAREFLMVGELLEEVEKTKSLFAIANDVLSKKTKDPDTVIYRLAMALFHAKTNLGYPALEGLEDPYKVYLNFITNETFLLKYKHVFDKLINLENNARRVVLKIFVPFIVAAYLYYSVANG